MPQGRANTCTLHVLCRHHTRSHALSMSAFLAKWLLNKIHGRQNGPGTCWTWWSISFLEWQWALGHMPVRNCTWIRKNIRKLKNYTSKHFCPCQSISSHSQLLWVGAVTPNCLCPHGPKSYLVNDICVSASPPNPTRRQEGVLNRHLSECPDSAC